MTNTFHDLRQQKQHLRSVMEARRAEASRQNPDAAVTLCKLFLANVTLPTGGIVSAYVACGTEMDPAPLVQALHSHGFEAALPVVVGRGKPLLFRLYRPGDILQPGVMDIPEPLAMAPAVEPDILLVPLLAFDRRGFRLGYGGGYYDRTLAGLRQRKTIRAIGIAYACQESQSVPTGARDERLDAVATENGIFYP